MSNNTDLILSANSPPDNEWDDLKRYDVDTLLKESQKKIDTVVKQVQAQAPKPDNTPRKNQ